MNTLNRQNPLLWLGLLLLAWLVLGVQLAAPKVASGPFYAATEHHLGVTRREAAPRLGLDAWTTKSASGDTVGAKGTGEIVSPAPVVSSGTTRTGVVRTNAADWRALRDNWDDLGYGQILSTENRAAIAKGRTPKVDDAWIKVFPEDAGLKGERIPMHHIQGSPLTVPLPDTRHLDAHMPGGFRYNPGGPGSALPAYPPKQGAE